MPEIPEGAKTPQDHQSPLVKPPAHPDGWDLLRPPVDLEFWETTEFLALTAEVKTRGDTVTLNATALRVIGKIAKIMQLEFANDSTAFRTWLKSGSFEDSATKLLPLIFAYAGELGEAVASES